MAVGAVRRRSAMPSLRPEAAAEQGHVSTPSPPRQHQVSEAFRQTIYGLHRDGINRRELGRREASARQQWNAIMAWHASSPNSIHGGVPTVLGSDEHFFTRRKGFATTLCDLRNHKVYDVVLGRSEASLSAYLQRLEDKEAVKVVCMDLSSGYRALVAKFFPNAVIVADRFHVIRLINHHFLACWRDLDPVAARTADCLR